MHHQLQLPNYNPPPEAIYLQDPEVVHALLIIVRLHQVRRTERTPRRAEVGLAADNKVAGTRGRVFSQSGLLQGLASARPD